MNTAERNAAILAAKEKWPEASEREIAGMVGTSQSTVNRVLNGADTGAPGRGHGGFRRPHGSRCGVYIARDDEGRVIYVGITGRGIPRNDEHISDAEWWPYLDAQKWEHFEDLGSAHRREVKLIERFKPPFNRKHNPRHVEIRADYLGSYKWEK